MPLFHDPTPTMFMDSYFRGDDYNEMKYNIRMIIKSE